MENLNPLCLLWVLQKVWLFLANCMAKRCCGTHPYLWWYDFVYFRILSAYILDILFSRKLKTCLVIFPALCLVLEDDHTYKESFFPLHHSQSEANYCTMWPNLFKIYIYLAELNFPIKFEEFFGHPM